MLGRLSTRNSRKEFEVRSLKRRSASVFFFHLQLCRPEPFFHHQIFSKFSTKEFSCLRVRNGPKFVIESISQPFPVHQLEEDTGSNRQNSEHYQKELRNR